MAQLKLMKKEWFNWFDKTFLDNITAWTEYYYINPDSQHWISNNFLDVNDSVPVTSSGVTYLIKDGNVNLNGTASRQLNITLAYNISIPAGYRYGAFHLGTIENGNINIYLIEQGVQPPQQLSSWNNVTKDTLTFIGSTAVSKDSKYNLVIVIASGTKLTNYNLKPSLTLGESAPAVFNPHLIKIEDILGVVDLGSLNYSYRESSGRHIFTTPGVTDLENQVDLNKVIRAFCPMYNATTQSATWKNMDFAYNDAVGYNTISFVNNFYNNVNDFKSAMSGVYMVYIKADSPY